MLPSFFFAFTKVSFSLPLFRNFPFFFASVFLLCHHLPPIIQCCPLSYHLHFSTFHLLPIRSPPLPALCVIKPVPPPTPPPHTHPPIPCVSCPTLHPLLFNLRLSQFPMSWLQSCWVTRQTLAPWSLWSLGGASSTDRSDCVYLCPRPGGRAPGTLGRVTPPVYVCSARS